VKDFLAPPAADPDPDDVETNGRHKNVEENEKHATLSPMDISGQYIEMLPSSILDHTKK
jgi:hypothetical protein